MTAAAGDDGGDAADILSRNAGLGAAGEDAAVHKGSGAEAGGKSAPARDTDMDTKPARASRSAAEKRERAATTSGVRPRVHKKSEFRERSATTALRDDSNVDAKLAARRSKWNAADALADEERQLAEYRAERQRKREARAKATTS